MTTYWNHEGKHQTEYNRLYEKLVPASGRAGTQHGELLRAICKLYYDYYNNGACNYPIHKQHIGTLENWREEIKSKIEDTTDFDSLIRAFWKHAFDEDCMYFDDLDESKLEELTDAVILVVLDEDQKLSENIVDPNACDSR